MKQIYSFDVFDTCLIRKCGLACNLFDILANEILGDESPESTKMDFVNIRIEGEKIARNNSTSEEIKIHEIYSNCDFTGITEIKNEDIQRSELELEKRILVPVISVKEKINLLREEGKQILFISDMYIPYSDILDSIKLNGFFQPEDKLYVSCEIGLTKNTGNLYKYIRDENGYSFNNWKHTGDNF